MIKQFIFVFLAVLVTSLINGQEKIEKNGVTINSSQIRCTSLQNGTDNMYISLKVHNSNNYPVSIQFDKKMWYDGACVNCESNSDEYKVTLTLAANQTIEGFCDKKDYQLLIFHSMPSGLTTTKLTDFKIENLLVTPMK